METIDPLTRKTVALHRRKALEKQIITTTLASAMLKKAVEQQEAIQSGNQEIAATAKRTIELAAAFSPRLKGQWAQKAEEAIQAADEAFEQLEENYKPY